MGNLEIEKKDHTESKTISVTTSHERICSFARSTNIYRKYYPLAYLYERLYGLTTRKLMIMSETPENKKKSYSQQSCWITTHNKTKKHTHFYIHRKKNEAAVQLNRWVKHRNAMVIRIEWAESWVHVDYFWLLYLLLCINSPVSWIMDAARWTCSMESNFF